MCNGVVRGDKRLDIGSNLLFVDRVLHVEIKPAFRRRNIATGYTVLEDRPQQMQCGMHAHVQKTPVPVQNSSDDRASRRQRSILID